jgi:hypothetical protein
MARIPRDHGKFRGADDKWYVCTYVRFVERGYCGRYSGFGELLALYIPISPIHHTSWRWSTVLPTIYPQTARFRRCEMRDGSQL